MPFTDSRVEPENDTKAKPEMTDGFDTGPSTEPLEATLRVQGPGKFLMTVFLFWDGGVAYRGAAGIGAPLVPAAGRDEPRKTAKCGKRLKNGLLAIF